MNVEITGRHVVITPAIESFVLKQLRRFNRAFGDQLSFHVIVDVEKQRHTVEILMKSKFLDLTCKAQTNDMYNSILRAVEKLERQALKHKSKIIEGKRHQAKVKAQAEKTGTAPSAPAVAAARRRRRGNGIVEEESHRKPMAIEEAVLELGHSEYPFVVFRNVESGAVNVLYRRKDGGLGLIHA